MRGKLEGLSQRGGVMTEWSWCVCALPCWATGHSQGVEAASTSCKGQENRFFSETGRNTVLLKPLFSPVRYISDFGPPVL